MQCYYSYCIECNNLPNEKNFNKCPLLKKTLCKKCLELDKYTLLNKSQILKIYRINAELVKVGWWTYRFLFEDKSCSLKKVRVNLVSIDEKSSHRKKREDERSKI